MLSVNEIFAKTIHLDDLEIIDNRLGCSEAKTSTDLSFSDHKSNYSVDDHDTNTHVKDYNMWSGKYEPMFEMTLDKRPKAILKEKKEPFHPLISNDDFEITRHLSKSSSTDLILNIKEEGGSVDQVSKIKSPKIGEDNESIDLNVSDKSWPLLDCSFNSQINSVTEEYYPPNSMEYYLQEFNDGINQLARWSLRMKELTNLEPEEFKAALDSFRDRTGENPLRTWTVKANTAIGLIMDIQHEMESEISSLR